MPLKRTASETFGSILRLPVRLIARASTTADSGLFTTMMSTESIAMSVPPPTAMPTSAYISDGASLIPSPTVAVCP